MMQQVGEQVRYFLMIVDRWPFPTNMTVLRP